MLNVISPVPRSSAPALTLHGQPGSSLNLEFTAMLKGLAELGDFRQSRSNQYLAILFRSDQSSCLHTILPRLFRSHGAGFGLGLCSGHHPHRHHWQFCSHRLHQPARHSSAATSGSADYTDADVDRLNNWQEWRCQTDPLNARSALRLLSAFPTAKSVAVTWQSVAAVNYSLERSTNIAIATGFTTIATNIAGRGSATVYADTNTSESPAFYRVLLNN